MNKNLVVHLSDIHIRLNSRHEEYREVFEKTIEKIKEIKPLGIVITGDVFHIKINMSPKSVSLAGWFLKELSKISTVFCIVGNHDLNEKILIQGNTVEPLIEILENGFVLNKEDSKEIIKLYRKNDTYGIYFFKETSFYEFDNGLIFGAFSMIDNEKLFLNEKELDKKYIALYHNPVYGCKMDNGMENKREDLAKITDFAGFDIVMLGDIHKYQTFKRKNILEIDESELDKYLKKGWKKISG
jgi:DNA repair exonuclease SbcCD nuclease subunit